MSHRLTVLNFVQKAPPCDLLKLRELSIAGERPANYMFLSCAANNTMLAVEKMMEIERMESVANTCTGFTNVMGFLRRDANGNIATLNRKAFDETEEDAEFTKRLRKSNTNIAHTQLSASFVNELCSRVSADCNSKGKESVKEVFFLALLRRKGMRLCSIGSRTFNGIRFYDELGHLEDCVPASEIMGVRSLAEIATSEDGILNDVICGWYLLKKQEEKGMVSSHESDVLAALEKTIGSGDYTEKLHHVWTYALDGESVVKIRNELMRVASAGDGFSLWAWLLNLFGSLAVSRLFDKIVGWVPRRYRFWLRFASKGGAQRGSFR